MIHSRTAISGSAVTPLHFWCNTTAYAAGDASITTYKLGARQDDSYYSTFESSGWWNADKLSDD